MELELIGCGLSSLSDIQDDIAEVQVLNLHGNSLMSLEGLLDTSTLLELNLSSNLFTSSDLPELAFLPALKSLDLSGNRILCLQGLPFLPSVSSFAVAFNGISSLNGIFNFPNLEMLDCRGNLISAADDCMHIQPLGKLQQLYLSSEDGRYSNPLVSKPLDVLQIFDKGRYFGTIDGKNRHEWTTDTLPLPTVYTPKFDMVAKRFLAGAEVQSISRTGNGQNDSVSDIVVADVSVEKRGMYVIDYCQY